MAPMSGFTGSQTKSLHFSTYVSQSSRVPVCVDVVREVGVEWSEVRKQNEHATFGFLILVFF